MSAGIIFKEPLLRRWGWGKTAQRPELGNVSDICCIETIGVKENHEKSVAVPAVVQPSEQKIEHGLECHHIEVQFVQLLAKYHSRKAE